MCVIVNTKRDMYIWNCAVTLYTLQLDAYNSLLLIRLPRYRPPGLYGHIFIAIAFCNTNYVLPAATRLTWAMIRIG